MADPFANFTRSPISGADSWAAVTPNDSADLTTVPKGIMVNVAGDVSLTGEDGVAATFTLAASTPYPLRPRRVRSTGTTATGIRALY